MQDRISPPHEAAVAARTHRQREHDEVLPAGAE